LLTATGGTAESTTWGIRTYYCGAGALIRRPLVFLFSKTVYGRHLEDLPVADVINSSASSLRGGGRKLG